MCPRTSGGRPQPRRAPRRSLLGHAAVWQGRACRQRVLPSHRSAATQPMPKHVHAVAAAASRGHRPRGSFTHPPTRPPAPHLTPPKRTALLGVCRRGDEEADDNSKRAAELAANHWLASLPESTVLEVRAPRAATAHHAPCSCGAAHSGPGVAAMPAAGHPRRLCPAQHAQRRCLRMRQPACACTGLQAACRGQGRSPPLTLSAPGPWLPQRFRLRGPAAQSCKFMPVAAPRQRDSLRWLWSVVRLQGLHNLYGLRWARCRGPWGCLLHATAAAARPQGRAFAGCDQRRATRTRCCLSP